MLSLLADALFPPRCGVCRTGGVDPLCAACRAEFTAIPPPLCARCGIPLGVRARRRMCARCLRAPPAFAAATSAALYAGRMRVAIHRFKFDGRVSLGRPLGAFLGGHARGSVGRQGAGVVVPVPLHQARLRERGYDQAALLARGVSEALEIPLATAVLRRVRPTVPQADLGRAARAANVRGAFRTDPGARSAIVGRRILLVDDILTSGATASVCAEVLLAAGAAQVRVVTLARALLVGLPPSAAGAGG